MKEQILKIKRIGQGHIFDKSKWIEFADEIDVLLKMVDSQKSSVIDGIIESRIPHDSTGCNICGSKKVMIRGRYPKDPKRSVCPTCAVEKLESHEEQHRLANETPTVKNLTAR